MLTVHHLRRSPSERIVWLCEELGLAYEVKCYDRNKTDMLAPPEYKALHPMGIAPVITDGDLVLGESGAVVEYILAKHGPGGLARGPADPDFADYLYWLHFANGTPQATIGRNMLLHRLDVPAEEPLAGAMRARLGLVLARVEARCAQAPYLAGEALSAADIMSVFSLTTMRSFSPLELAPYPQIRAYLQQRIGVRDAYRRAMKKGDPEMAPMLG
jgi:glutathione S-transferase